MKRKYLAIILIILSVFNLIFLGICILQSIFRTPNTGPYVEYGIIIPLIIVQILNVVLLLLVLRKNKYIKLIFLFVILVSLLTIVIPVKEEINLSHSIENENKIRENKIPIDTFENSTTTTIREYKNLYSITLKRTEHTEKGYLVF